jgi:hypothetical protein
MVGILVQRSRCAGGDIKRYAGDLGCEEDGCISKIRHRGHVLKHGVVFEPREKFGHLLPPCAAASRNGRESGEPAERMLTTRTPLGPSSAARFLENATIAPTGWSEATDHRVADASRRGGQRQYHAGALLRHDPSCGCSREKLGEHGGAHWPHKVFRSHTEVFSQCYERGSVLVTPDLPFEGWTSVFGSERLTSALLDRLTHHVHILELNGDSYRLKQSKGRRKTPASADDEAPAPETIDPETGEITS